jgi:hypothetical protein
MFLRAVCLITTWFFTASGILHAQLCRVPLNFVDFSGTSGSLELQARAVALSECGQGYPSHFSQPQMTSITQFE